MENMTKTEKAVAAVHEKQKEYTRKMFLGENCEKVYELTPEELAEYTAWSKKLAHANDEKTRVMALLKDAFDDKNSFWDKIDKKITMADDLEYYIDGETGDIYRSVKEEPTDSADANPAPDAEAPAPVVEETAEEAVDNAAEGY